MHQWRHSADGCTQTPEDFAVGTGMNRVAETEGLVVVYPEQTRSENSMGCWNWFRPGDQVFGGTGFKLGAHAGYACVSERKLEKKPANMALEESAAVSFPEFFDLLHSLIER